MFWNKDIKEVREWMVSVSYRLTDLQVKMDGAIQQQEDQSKFIGHHFGVIKDFLIDVLDIDVHDESNPNTLHLMHQKINELLRDDRRKEEVAIATKTLDKFEDYMKNVDKLNEMANELKGCVSMARSAIGEGRALTSAIQQVEHIANISNDIRKGMVAFIQASDKMEHEAHYKIDFIYNNIAGIAEKLQKQEKKSHKKRKSTKKTSKAL
jgi:hypothetical protein